MCQRHRLGFSPFHAVQCCLENGLDTKIGIIIRIFSRFLAYSGRDNGIATAIDVILDVAWYFTFSGNCRRAFGCAHFAAHFRCFRFFIPVAIALFNCARRDRVFRACGIHVFQCVSHCAPSAALPCAHTAINSRCNTLHGERMPLCLRTPHAPLCFSTVHSVRNTHLHFFSHSEVIVPTSAPPPSNTTPFYKIIIVQEPHVWIPNRIKSKIRDTSDGKRARLPPCPSRKGQQRVLLQEAIFLSFRRPGFLLGYY